MYLLAIFRVIAGLWKPRRYRPELHYMRGRGPEMVRAARQVSRPTRAAGCG